MSEKLTLDDLFEGRLYINIYEKQKDDIDGVITEADLRSFYRCPYSYFLKKHIGLTKAPKSGFAAQALMFQQARKALFNLKDPKKGRLFPYQTRAGPDLKMAEEMTGEELRTHLANNSAEAFGNSLRGKWAYFVGNGKYAGSPLVWSFKGQEGIAGKQLMKAGMNYYNFVIEQGAPILGFMNTTETFEYRGLLFNVRFPEVREGMIIDDPTIWGFNLDEKFDKRSNDIDTSSLVTLRLLGFCRAVHETPFYRLKLRIDDKIADMWDGKRMTISPDVTYRHFNATEAEMSETHRSDDDLDLFMRVVVQFLDEIQKERFAPNHTHCGSCQYNVLDPNGDVLCREAKKGVKPSVPSQYFKKKSFEIDGNEDDRGLTIIGNVRKDESITKETCRYDISVEEKEGTLVATSRYESKAYGLGFEERMLEEVDRKLQQVADSKGKTLVHRVEFDRDFGFAGKKSVNKKLVELGYDDMQKEYVPQK